MSKVLYGTATLAVFIFIALLMAVPRPQMTDATETASISVPSE